MSKITTPKVRLVFLIDDSEVDLYIHKKFLELSAFAEKIIGFSSPIKALEAIQAIQAATAVEVPSLIFLDLNMPLLNGFEFLEKLNTLANGIHSKVKVVILTSSNSPADRLKAKEFPNVIDFFSKPLNIDELKSLSHSL